MIKYSVVFFAKNDWIPERKRDKKIYFFLLEFLKTDKFQNLSI